MRKVSIDRKVFFVRRIGSVREVLIDPIEQRGWFGSGFDSSG